MLRKDLKALTRESDLIVIGRVVNIDSQVEEKGQVFTYVSIKVDEYVKGEPLQEEIVIAVPGGRKGELTMWVSEAAKFRLGETNLLFLSHFRNNLYQVVGGVQGKLTVEKGNVSEYEMTLDEVLDRIRRELQ
jgi:hypothetical protein